MNSLDTTNLLINALLGTVINNGQEFLSQAINELSTNFNDIISSVLGSLTGLLTGKRAIQLQTVISQVQEALPLIQQTLSQLAPAVMDIYQQFAVQFQTILTTLGFPQGRAHLLVAAQNAKADLMDAFNDILNAALGHLTDIATSLANVGLASLLTVLQGKRDLFSDLFGSLGATWDNLTGTLINVGSSLLDAVTPHLQDLQDQLTNHALNAAQSLLASLAGISSTLSGRDLFSDLFGSLGATWDNLTGTLVNVGSSLLDAVTPHLQDLQDQLTNHALNAAQSLLASLAGISATLQG